MVTRLRAIGAVDVEMQEEHRAGCAVSVASWN